MGSPFAAVVTPASSAHSPSHTGSAAINPLLAPDMARIIGRGELVVAMLRTDTPPFFFEDHGDMKGLDVDIAQELAKNLNVKVRFNRTATTFNQVIDVVARKDADIAISKLARTLGRATFIQFSDPYMSMNHALVLNRLAFAKLAHDKPLQTVMRSFNGPMGVIAETAYVDFAERNFPHAKVKTYPDWSSVVAAVNSGEVIAAYRDEFEIKRIFKTDPSAALKLRTVTLKDQEVLLSIAVGAQDSMLRAFINEFLRQRHDKLTVGKALERAEKP
jgi:ABC-type amino acid transport substrate-binding protein